MVEAPHELNLGLHVLEVTGASHGDDLACSNQARALVLHLEYGTERASSFLLLHVIVVKYQLALILGRHDVGANGNKRLSASGKSVCKSRFHCVSKISGPISF